MKIKTTGSYNLQDAKLWSLSGNCPSCGQYVRFEAVGVGDLIANSGKVKFCQRRCPDPKCGQHMFFVSNGAVTEGFPPERLDFDVRDIPDPIVTSFTEAIACHSAGCYIASAIMVRRTLEELCADRGATGNTLKDRIVHLRTKVVLPTDLLAGLDDLRLLGNNAAHLESKDYDKVGKEEIEVAVEFTKEVLKAVYQYKGLLARLQGLKKQPNP